MDLFHMLLAWATGLAVIGASVAAIFVMAFIVVSIMAAAVWLFTDRDGIDVLQSIVFIGSIVFVLGFLTVGAYNVGVAALHPRAIQDSTP